MFNGIGFSILQPLISRFAKYQGPRIIVIATTCTHNECKIYKNGKKRDEQNEIVLLKI